MEADDNKAITYSAFAKKVKRMRAELGDDELSAAQQALQEFEEELSSARRSLHRAIDVLNAELARRIALGESSASPS